MIMLFIFTGYNSREDSGLFSKRPGYQVTMKKVAQLQEKIEGWEVRTYVHQIVCVMESYLRTKELFNLLSLY